MTGDVPEAPDHLEGAARSLWESVAADYHLTEHELALLLVACEARQQIDVLGEALREHGMTYADRFGQPRERPECAMYHRAAQTMRMATRELRLHEQPEASRAPRLVS